MSRKAMSMPMEIVIAIVVLVVIALAVILTTNNSITEFFGITKKTTEPVAVSMECQGQRTAYKSSGGDQYSCPACPEKDCKDSAIH